MRKLIPIFISTVFYFISCTSTPVIQDIPAPSSHPDANIVTESWAYLMQGEEKLCSPELPVSDLGYFIKAFNTYSELEPVPPREKYFSDYNCRIHIVSSVDSRSQTHLLLDPSLPLRNKVIKDLVTAAQTYDGIQIDWEGVTARDKENYMSFLYDLKKNMGNKILSVAIAARVKKLSKDAYDYEDLSKVADKIIIMAYDEHWSTSKPGAVASLEWGSKVCDYAVSVIPGEKLVMGLPFYGRTWSDDTEGKKAYKYKSMQEMLSDKKVKIERDSGNIKNYKFRKKITIEGWFDDALSLNSKINSYMSKGVDKVAFWRIGQEDPFFWQYLKVKEE